MKKGFTLIELLVVVLIIGILSAIALPQYTAAVEKSRAGEALVILKHAQQARMIDYLQNPNAPSTPKDIMELSGGTWRADGGAYCTKNFRYAFDDCTVAEAYRCIPKADCSDCQNDTEYEINLFNPFYGEDWESEHYCAYSTDLGHKVCNGLAGQGFNIIEY